MRNKRENIRCAAVLILVAGVIICTAPSLTSSGLAYAQAAAPNWSYTGSLNTARVGHTATLLPNGKVLITGGHSANGILASAELYDPSTGTWSPTGNLNAPRIYHSATLLQNGKVLVAGGYANSCCEGAPAHTAEIYDPGTGGWSLTGNLHIPRFVHTATLLSNGKVLFAGGATNTAELYDPPSGTWSITGNLKETRVDHTATLLRDGKVLVVGGCGDLDCFVILGNAELYDPNTGAWSYTGDLNTPRYIVSVTITLQNGNVLVAGGSGPFNLNSAELYNPDTGRWSYTGNLLSSRIFATATLLPSGQVLASGGYHLNSAEIYDPTTGTWNTTASLNAPRSFHTATLLQSGKVLVVGGWDMAHNGPLLSAELYDSGSSSTINPIYDAQFFVRQQYLDFLNREPDTAGFNDWLNVLINCGPAQGGLGSPPECDRVHVSSGFFRSTEFGERGYWIYRFYESALGRRPQFAEFLPESQGLSGLMTTAELEAKRAAFISRFMQLPEFQANFNGLTDAGHAAQFVAKLEQVARVNLLASANTEPGQPPQYDRQQLIDLMSSGQFTAAQTMRAFIEQKVVWDTYFYRAFVAMQYFGYLRRDPEAAGYNDWVRVLTFGDAPTGIQPGDYRHLIFGFVYSIEYRERFGQP